MLEAHEKHNGKDRSETYRHHSNELSLTLLKMTRYTDRWTGTQTCRQINWPSPILPHHPPLSVSEAPAAWCSVHHSCWPGERNNCLTLDAGPGCCSIHHRYWSGEREKQLITSVVALTMKPSSSQLLVWQTTVLNQMLVLADALFIIDTGLENKGHNLLHQMLVLHEAQFIIFAGLEKDWDTCIKSDAGTAWSWSSVYYHERYGENCITSDTVLAWTSADLSYQHKKKRMTTV